MTAQSVLITGCSAGGIGPALARSFQKRGVHVFATARDVSKMANLQQLSNVTLLKLDVTSAEDIRAAVEAVKAHTGGSLDYLVNNSGTAPGMPLLDVDIDAAKALFDVNFWAIITMTQAFMPLLIAAKGTLVNNSSVCAVCTTTHLGIYTASKAAVTALGNVLRVEVEPFGVKVVTIMTGGVESIVMSRYDTVRLPSGSLYLAAEEEFRLRAEGREKIPRMNADVYADKVVSDVMGRANGLIWRGKFATVLWLLSTFAPVTLLDYAGSAGMALSKVKQAYLSGQGQAHKKVV